MKKAVSARWRVVGGLLLAIVFWMGARPGLCQNAPQTDTPAAAAGGVSAEKQAKLSEVRSRGDKAFAAGNFAKAVQWYQSAQQLAPQDAQAAQLLAGAQRMLDEQHKLLAKLPTDEAARNQKLSDLFQQASQYYRDKQYDQAYESLYTLWLTAGDYKGKVVKMYQKSGQELAKSGKQPADLMQPAASAPVAVPAADGVMVANAEPVTVVTKADDAAPAVVAVQDAASSPVAKLSATTPEAIHAYLADANDIARSGQYDQAIQRYREVLKADPNNAEAVAAIDKAQAAKTKAEKADDPKSRLQERREIDVLQKEAVKLYQAGDLKQARERWQQILDQTPDNKMAQTWLEETREAFERQQADTVAKVQTAKLSEEAEKLLAAPVSISTVSRIPLTDFMKNLSFVTPSPLQFSIAGEANASIFADFQDKPLREVLDTVLLPIGLKWSMDEKNVITIRPSFVSKTYNLAPSQMSKVKALLDSGELQKMIWGQTEPPAEGVRMTLDERTNVLLLTGSNLHIERVESFLPTLKQVNEQDLIFRMYKIRKEDAPKIKALINSIIAASPDTPFELERKVFVEADTLIIRDTPQNITKIEELLLDKKFIEQMKNEKLDIQNFSLVPRDIESQNTDQVQAFTARVVESIKVFLYSQEGESKANEEGRRLWFDPVTYQLTIVDTPSNIARVSEYLSALPQLGLKQRQETIFLKFAVAETLAGSLERILDLTSGPGANGTSGDQVTWQLRRGESRSFGDISVRIMRVEQGDVTDKHDDSVELQITTGINVSTVTLRELETQFVEDYQITAENVLASSGQPGEGRARITIRRVAGAMGSNSMTAETNVRQQMLAEEKAQSAPKGIEINSFGELNAIIIRYSDPALFQDATDLIRQLDQAIRQVEIETKFVEVNETRAKEFSADFKINGLGSGRNIDWGTNSVNSQFAQDVNEFRDAFSPPIENPWNANLIKGTTAMKVLFGSFPGIELNLRMLEAEGILNIINGPKVTSIDGQEAEFRIEETGSGTTVATTNGSSFQIVNALDQTSSNMQLEDTDSATPTSALLNAVVLRVTPEITSDESILLNDLSAELIDFEGWMNGTMTPTITAATNATQTAQSFSTIAPPVAGVNFAAQAMVKRKKIITNARVGNGGTIVLGGWTGERTLESTSGVPVLRNMPYLGKLLFSRGQRTSDRTTLLIFLTCTLIK